MLVTQVLKLLQKVYKVLSITDNIVFQPHSSITHPYTFQPTLSQKKCLTGRSGLTQTAADSADRGLIEENK